MDVLYIHYIVLTVILPSYTNGVPIISPLVGQVHYATIGHNFSFSCLFDGDAEVFSLEKDDNTEVQLDKTACYQSSPITNYVVSCDDSELTVTIPTNQVTETLNNTSWQCSDTVTRSQIYILHVYERPEAGPYTEIHGGNRPFKDGEVVTHDCIVVGGNPKPTLTWICITPPQSRNTLQIGRKFIKQISIQLDNTHVFYNCACHAYHQTWNTNKIVISVSLLSRTEPIIVNSREVYSAESGKPVMVKVDYYAYPPIAAAVINRTDFSPIYSENITKIFQKKNNLRFMKKGLTYHSEGETIYWKIDMFNESDYGRYEMILENDVGPTKIYFNISSKGPPSEPCDVTIEDVTSEGFRLLFTPGYNGGYLQWFTLVYWPEYERSKNKTITVRTGIIQVQHLSHDTNYQLLLYSENEKGRSVESYTEPLFIRTEEGLGAGSHSLLHILYGVVAMCVLILTCYIVITTVNCYRGRGHIKIDVPSNSHTDPTSTLNTDRAVCTDRAVFNRRDQLPDGNTVDRMNERTKPKRAIKVPPILAVFRKSVGPPDLNVLSEAHDAVHRSTNNIKNEEEVTKRQREPHDLPPRQASTRLYLNYPLIEISTLDRRSPLPPPRSRQRTNYSQINFCTSVPQLNEQNDIEEDGIESGYGQIFFQSATLPPHVNM